MKLVLYISVFIGLLSCNNSNSITNYTQELPDSTMINEIIATVIEIDSLKHEYGISKNIQRLRVYDIDEMSGDSIITIPPPPIITIWSKELHSKFNPHNINVKRVNDSIFFSLQSDTSRKFEITEKLYSRFNQNSGFSYHFFMPIFSFDKQYVFIQYTIQGGGICTHSRWIFLRRSNMHWVIFDKFWV